jgi:hypothetical protein
MRNTLITLRLPHARFDRMRGPLLRHQPTGPATGAGGGSGDGGQGAGTGGGSGTGSGGDSGQSGSGGDGEGSGTGSGTGTGAGGQQQGDRPHGYPVNTPVEQMTAAEQTAYWRHHSRKHENALRGLGLTPGQEAADLKRLRDAEAELTQLKRADMSEVDRLKAELAEAQQTNTTLLADKVRSDAARDAKLPAHLWPFVTATDPQAAKAQAETLAASVKTGANEGGHDQGARGGQGDKPSVARGRELWQQRHGRKKQGTTTN